MGVALLQLLDISPQIRVAAVTALAAIAAVGSRGLCVCASVFAPGSLHLRLLTLCPAAY